MGVGGDRSEEGNAKVSGCWWVTPLPTRQNKQTRQHVNLPDLHFHNSDLAPVGVNTRPDKSKTNEDLTRKLQGSEGEQIPSVNILIPFVFCSKFSNEIFLVVA